jgi:prevent-host-death family protein
VKTVGASEARTHLYRLLDEVARGETVTITRNGVAVAQLVPLQGSQRMSVEAAIAAMDDFRKTHTLGDVTIRELVEEGRRY